MRFEPKRTICYTVSRPGITPPIPILPAQDTPRCDPNNRRR
jgi:hypothetical protein